MICQFLLSLANATRDLQRFELTPPHTGETIPASLPREVSVVIPNLVKPNLGVSGMSVSKNALIMTVCALASLSTVALGAPTIYTGVDAGAGPANAHPNTTTARNAFLVGAATLGTLKAPYTFESNALGYAATVSGTGFVASLTNLDTDLSGIRNSSSAIEGYNTTVGGAKFLSFSPIGGKTGTMTFTFTNPISAFGADFTGVGTQAFPVSVSFNDGKSVSYIIDGSTDGGDLFWGFTSAGARISSLTIQETPANTRDIFGIDQLTLASSLAATVPEPATWGIMIVGMVMVGGVLRRRSKFTMQVAYAR